MNPVLRPEIAKLVPFRIDVSFGTLWWIRESMWREKLGRGYGSSTTKRRRHPGVSILRASGLHRITAFELVPVLHGRSEGGKRSVRVTGLGENAERETFFGHFLTPAHLFYREITHPGGPESPDFSVDFPLRYCLVVKNRPKQKVNFEEEAALKKFVMERGLA